MTVSFGVTQGRLIPSSTGELQCFPQNHWAAEFDIAARVGLQYVELLAERVHNPLNPFWSAAGREAIASTARLAPLELHSTINDYVLEHDLATSALALEQSFEWIDAAAALGLAKLVVPLMDASEPSHRNLEPFVAPLRGIADRAASRGMEVCLETVMPMDRLIDLVHRVDRPGVGICFDTGNRAAQGFDIYKEISRTAGLLRHVHLKDKSAAGENVFLGTGTVNFRRAADALAAAGYCGAFTFEAPRGTHPEATAAYHLGLIRFFLEEAGTLRRGSVSEAQA